MPSHSASFGHLQIMRDTMNSLPAGCAADIAIAAIAKNFQNGAFYLDFMPFDRPSIIVNSVEVAGQVQKLTELNKPDYVASVVDTICGGKNMFTMSGHSAKYWRSIFSRGFSVAYMQTLAPLIAEEVSIFQRIMTEHTKRAEVVMLQDSVTKLTIDIIASIGM